MLLNGTTMPDGYCVYGHQVAGHRFEAGKQGMLLDSDGKLLKPIQAPPRGEREVEFYQTVFGYETSDETILKLRSFVPTFYGVKHVVFPELSLQDNYIILEDLTRNFSQPCILDIKIGKCVTDHLATPAKKERAKRKYPEQGEFGFRILGMKVYDEFCKHFKFYDKEFGKKLKTHEEILTGLRVFFCQEEHGKRHIEEIIEHLKIIKIWAMEQRIFRLYSSSVLIIYEGNKLLDENHKSNFHAEDTSATELARKLCTESLQNECSNCVNFSGNSAEYANSHSFLGTCRKQEKPKVSIHLVDFAHAYIGHYDEPDDNYLFGLCNLIHYFEQMIR